VSRLKTCPFCNYRAREHFSIGYPGKQYKVICNNCMIQTGWYPTQALANKAWNKRKRK